MAISSIGPSQYEFTADADKLLEHGKAESFLAHTGSTSGEVIVYTKIYNPSLNPGAWTYDGTNKKELWRSGNMSANAVVESAIDIGEYHGIEVSMPSGAKLILYTQNI